MLSSVTHIIKRQSDAVAGGDTQQIVNTTNARRGVGVALGVATGLIFLSSIFVLATKKGRRLPAAFLAAASLFSAINYGLTWNSIQYGQAIAQSVLAFLADTSAFLAFYSALGRQHWPLYLLALLIIPSAVVPLVLWARALIPYYLPYTSLAYASLLVINALALLGCALRECKVSQGTDRWARYSRAIVAPSFLIALIFNLIFNILLLPPIRDTILQIVLLRVSLAVLVVYGVTICVSLGLLAYHLNAEARNVKSGESAEKLHGHI